MGFWATLVQDGCDYAKLSGPAVEDITENDIIPFLEVGIGGGYRAPLYYADEHDWKTVYSTACIAYDDTAVPQDLYWSMAKWMGLLGGIVGGSASFFIWFTTCVTFSIRTWRFCALQLIMGALLRAGTFFFLMSGICSNDSGGSCTMYFGSRMDIVCTVMWITSSTLICAHFPTPKLRVVHDSDYVRKLPLQERQQQQNPAYSQQPKKKRRPKWPVRQRHEEVGGGDMGLEYHAKRLTPGVSGGASAAGSSAQWSKPPPSGDDTATYIDDGTTYYDDGQTYMDDGQTYMDDGQTYMDDGQTYIDDDENQTFFQDGEQSSAARSYNPGDYE
eukprot:CAMPEP_0195291388 /NCGR_PEP_ID=MMETSP0707-20130614/7769_1 /TAXON_ID=33640 /ORGANISM="Asterionellopsis glacialis, Strain CCMP134" /LENGTH=329 /DNA_ID=CAMNT_0040351699 /DNA_START=249 /DNA_END=1238 /DNA_ORIENTATION=+